MAEHHPADSKSIFSIMFTDLVSLDTDFLCNAVFNVECPG